MTLRNECKKGIDTLGLTLSDDAVSKLLQYMELLRFWNKTINLTAITKPQEMLSKHIFDSLSILPYVRLPRLLDVGAGAGLPGMVLAIAHPELHVTLLDAVAKKTHFMKQAAYELKLDNVSVVHARVETFACSSGFDTIVSRAFSTIDDMLLKTDHLLNQDGRVLAMKGVYPEAELVTFPLGYKLEAVHALHVAGLMASRHVVCLKKEGS